MTPLSLSFDTATDGTPVVVSVTVTLQNEDGEAPVLSGTFVHHARIVVEDAVNGRNALPRRNPERYRAGGTPSHPPRGDALDIRTGAADALGTIGELDSIEGLEAATDDPERSVRAATSTALATIESN